MGSPLPVLGCRKDADQERLPLMQSRAKQVFKCLPVSRVQIGYVSDDVRHAEILCGTSTRGQIFGASTDADQFVGRCHGKA